MSITGCMTAGFAGMVSENPLPVSAGLLLLIGSSVLAATILKHTCRQVAPLLEADVALARRGRAPEHPERRPTTQKIERLVNIQKGTVVALIAEVAVTCGIFYFQGCLNGGN